MGAGLAMGVTKLQENILKDQPLNKEAAAIGPMTSSFLIGVPLSYYMSAKNELKARKGQGLSNTENFIRKNPLISGITGSLASGFLLKGMNKSVGKLSTKMKKYPNKPTGFFGKEAGLYPETLNLIFKEITTS